MGNVVLKSTKVREFGLALAQANQDLSDWERIIAAEGSHEKMLACIELMIPQGPRCRHLKPQQLATAFAALKAWKGVFMADLSQRLAAEYGVEIESSPAHAPGGPQP